MPKRAPRPTCSMFLGYVRRGRVIGPASCDAPAVKWIAGIGYCAEHALDACYHMAHHVASPAITHDEGTPAEVLARYHARIAAAFQRMTGQPIQVYEASRGITHQQVARLG